MGGFGGMHEVGRGAGAGEGGGDLARDVAGLADAGDDDAAAAGENQRDRPGKAGVEAVDQAGDGLRLDAQHPFREFQRLRIGFFNDRDLVHSGEFIRLEEKYTKLTRPAPTLIS